MLISVIVSTYNRPDALEAVLLSLLDQTDTRYEIIIADDGSAEPTQAVVRRFQDTAAQARLTRSSAPQVIHAWHSDDGFRLSAVRNLGVHASAGDYLIFLDGDCVVRSNFVARHRTLAEAGFMVSGSRVLLSEKWTARALQTGDAPAATRRSILYWLIQRLRGNANKVVPLLVMPDSGLRHYRKVRWNRIKGCNLGIWRKDYAAVNGCDETFVGWGHEDADLVLRLARHGVRRKSGACSTEIFHLWHKENTRTTESANRHRVEQRMESGVTQADVGLRDYPRADQRITR
ncbi:MAG TPA: glycosyltransferase family 2 protein [Herbaspirillum sp.]|jgi:glycosyltransferase involved in cell wall biosynthesis|nr:glycosyltransferase family 2 protein [Herbaspirillum sp.]